MRSGFCPKCSSETVFEAQNGVGLGSNAGAVSVFIGIFGTPSRYTSYLCATCGYVEYYIDDRAKLQAVAEHWQKVNPPSAGAPPVA